MKELSVFIDESGDFGEYNDQSPYYIITMVFHDQSILIEEEIHKLDQELFTYHTEERMEMTNWVHFGYTRN